VRQHRLTSILSCLAIALASFLILSFSGFVSRYQSAVEQEVDGLGYDMLITARGCPYEAATLMLRGGVGLRYMPSGSLRSIQSDKDIASVFPTLIHPVRDPASDSGMLLFRGVAVESFTARSLVFEQGEAFESGDVGVVLGHEIAELEQLSVGDSFLIPKGLNRPATPVPVVGVLARNGGQEDGSLMMSLPALQALFGLEDKLTGVGVQLSDSAGNSLQAVQERYEKDPALQVVQLSAVLERLRMATDNLRTLVVLLGSLIGVLALGLVFVTTLLRASVAHAQVVVLHAVGLSRGFLFLAAVVENGLIVGAGVALGALATFAGGNAVGAVLGAQLDYVPSGTGVGIDVGALMGLVLVGLCFAILAAVPRWIRLGRSHPQQMRGA